MSEDVTMLKIAVHADWVDKYVEGEEYWHDIIMPASEYKRLLGWMSESGTLVYDFHKLIVYLPDGSYWTLHDAAYANCTGIGHDLVAIKVRAPKSYWTPQHVGTIVGAVPVSLYKEMWP
jgi:hypothetical protein